MSPRALGRLLVGFAALLAVVCVAVVRSVALRPPAHPVTVQSAWRGGELVARSVASEGPLLVDGDPAITRVDEIVVGEAPILTSPEIVFALSIVAGRDGVSATLDGKTAYLTPDDLLARQAYDHGGAVASLTLAFGVDVPLVHAMLAERLATTVPELRARAVVRRVRMERHVVTGEPAAPPVEPVQPATLTEGAVRAAALDAARYLARGVRPDGRFRYLVDAPTNQTLAGYDWPRHAGATYFLAQAAELAHDPEIAHAALATAAHLRDEALATCGDAPCVGRDDVVDLGSSALATIAFAEIAQTGLDPSYAPLVSGLARFLRKQQRADGEFQHRFDRARGAPVDVQGLYFSGEATLALARAHAVTGDPADLDAARRGLAHLVGPAWRFFGNRYYFGEEHWTCQAMADLWARAPDADALDFCDRWHAYGRRMMYAPGETPFDADGAFGVGPLVTPRLTPVASRSEAAVATLDAGLRAGWPEAKLAPLEDQLQRSLALLLRSSFRPGPRHLFADPAAVYGAMPGSAVDWQLRIDYAQHAGSAMIRWLAVSELVAKRNAVSAVSR